MRAKLQTPKHSVSIIYEDDRVPGTPYAINVRHVDTTEILRFRKPEEAEEARKAFRKQGYTILRTAARR